MPAGRPAHSQASEAKPKRKRPAPDSWAAIGKTLKSWDQARLLGLIHDLFDSVPDARAAIVGRITGPLPTAAREATLEELRGRIRKLIRPSRKMMDARPRFRDAKGVCDQYLKSSVDADGAIVLNVELVNEGARLLDDLGWDENDGFHWIDHAAKDVVELVPIATDATMLAAVAERVRPWLRVDLGGDTDEWIEEIVEVAENRVKELTSPAGSAGDRSE